MVKSYEDLAVWQQSMLLVEKIYRNVDAFPKGGFQLADQLCRAVISVPSNIAEGSMRHTTKDYLRFIAIAQGSLAEVETQLMIAWRLNYLAETAYHDTMETARRIGKLLNGLSSALERKVTKTSSPVTSTSHQHALSS